MSVLVCRCCALATWTLALSFGQVGDAITFQGATGIYGFSGNSSDDTLTVFNLSTGTVVGEDIDLLPEGDYPYDVTLNPAGSEVWICGANGDGIIVVDAINHTILQRISLTGQAENPVDIAFSADGNTAYVAGRDSDAVAVIDSATYLVVDSIPITSDFFGPGKMAFSPARNELYVVGWFTDELHIVDAATEMVTTLEVGTQLWDLVLSPQQDTLYITDRGADEVHVFDLDLLEVVSSITVGDDPWGIDVTRDGQRLVVASEDEPSVSVIDLGSGGTVTSVALPVDADPRDVDISPNGSLAWVPSGEIAGNDVIYVIDVISPSITDSVMLGNVEPNAIAVTPDVIAPPLFRDGFESVAD